jgi:hypothetical protein
VFAGCRVDSTDFEYSGKTKVLTVRRSTPTGLLLAGTGAVGAERLVIGPRCDELGGFFAPLLKKVTTLDLRRAPATLRVHRRAFAGIAFKDVLTPGFGSAQAFCGGFLNAFEASGKTRMWCDVKELRGDNPLENFVWSDFPNLVDVSETNWTILPDVPVAIKECVLPKMLLVVPDGAFGERTQPSRVIFGQVVAEIGVRAFSGCTSLRSLDLPASVKRIGE